MRVFPPFHFIWNDKLTLQYSVRWKHPVCNGWNFRPNQTEPNQTRITSLILCVAVVSLPLKFRHNFRYSVLAQSTFVIQIYSITFRRSDRQHCVELFTHHKHAECLHTYTHWHNAGRISAKLCYTCRMRQSLEFLVNVCRILHMKNGRIPI